MIHELLIKDRTEFCSASTSVVHMHELFSDRACEMNRELHEYGGLVFNAQNESAL